jgi:hypothetical protein
MGNDRSAVPIADAESQPCKLQQQVQLMDAVEDLNLAKLKQTSKVEATNNKPVNKHQEVQLQLQDLNFAKLNQTTISSIQRTNEQASTSEPVMSVKNNIAQIHCRQD